MKKLLLICLLAILTGSFKAQPTRVKGYRKKNGTYVAPHMKTKPNNTEKDNYSSKPNVNPYTGKKGKKRGKK